MTARAQDGPVGGPAGDGTERTFGRRAVPVLLAAAAALGISLFFMVFGEPPRQVTSAGADAFSRSALGYHALVAFLEEAGTEVWVSRYQTLDRVGPDAGLLLLEPPTGADRVEEVVAMVRGAVDRGAPVVVVVPEWRSRPDPDDPTRVRSVERIPLERLEGLLAALWAMEERKGMPGRPGNGDSGDLSGPLAVGLVPVVFRPQVMYPHAFAAASLLESRDGALILRDPTTGLTVVSDPDLFNTHGLGRGDNALVAHRLLIRGGGEGGSTPKSWVVDETLHGYEVVPSVAREMLELPLVFFTLQAALLGALATWAAARRFGRPLVAPPRLAAGARTLIDNTARLLAYGGHHAEAIDRYLDVVMDDGAEALGVPSGLGRRERVARLASAAAARGVTEDLEDIALRVRGLQGGDPRAVAPRAFMLARRLWAWREEVIHGAG